MTTPRWRTEDLAPPAGLVPAVETTALDPHQTPNPGRRMVRPDRCRGPVLRPLNSRDLIAFTIVWPAASPIVGASVLVHGITATPVTWMFGVRQRDAFRSAVATPGKDPLEVSRRAN
jgi:hypothetical protein